MRLPAGLAIVGSDSSARAPDVAPLLAQADLFVYAPVPGVGTKDLVVMEALLYGLLLRPHHAALAIRYLEHDHPLLPFHVAMGATLFYRDVLDRIEFRAEPGSCECMACCNDVRRMGYGIGYLPRLAAQHLEG